MVNNRNLAKVLIGLCNLFYLQDEYQSLELNPKHIVIGMELGTRSHVKHLFEISKTLNERGHQISYVTYEDNLRFSQGYNVTQHSFGPPPINIKELHQNIEQLMNSDKIDALHFMATGLSSSMYNYYPKSFISFVQYFKNQKPDVIICDFFSPACADAARQQKIPLIIGFQSIDIADIISAPFITRTFDSTPTTTLSMNIWQRLYYTIWMPIKTKYVFSPMIRNMNNLRAQFKVPPAAHQFGNWNNALLIANTYINFESARPIPQNLKLIGPIITPNPSPLSDDLKKFIDTHERTLFVAFGSIVSLNTFHFRQVMEGALLAMDKGVINGIVWGLGRTSPESLPEYFDYKGEKISSKNILKGDHPDIRILPWAPQQTLLSERNVKVFISHGGLESTFESLHSGTPILSYPWFGDQPRNGRRVQELGVGYFVDRLNTNPKEIYEKLNKIVADKSGSISKNIQKMQILSHIGSRRQIQAADIIEEYAYTSEVCKKFEAQHVSDDNDNTDSIPCEIEHLVPVSDRMPFIQAYKIDVYVLAFTMLLGSIGTFALGIYMSLIRIKSQYRLRISQVNIAKKLN